MGYKNPKELLTDGLKFPTAIEEMLPDGAPKISEMLKDVADRTKDLPDFPIEAPNLPEPPKKPTGLKKLGKPGGVKEVVIVPSPSPTGAVAEAEILS